LVAVVDGLHRRAEQAVEERAEQAGEGNGGEERRGRGAKNGECWVEESGEVGDDGDKQ